MVDLTIGSFTAFAGLLLAARKLATDPDPLHMMKALADLARDGKALKGALAGSGLSGLAAEMKRAAADADRAFVADLEAAKDARALFWQVAPTAVANGATLAGAGLVAAGATDAMVAAIHASNHGRDFARTAMAETYFRAVTLPTLAKMLDNATFVDGIAPHLWRESLHRHGVQIEMMEQINAKVDLLLERFGATEPAKVARESGVSEAALVNVARLIAPDVADAQTAFRELENWVELAVRVQTEGQAGLNLGDVVDSVARRVAEHAAVGEYDAAIADIESGRKQLHDEQNEKEVALLEMHIDICVLSRDAFSAAKMTGELAFIQYDIVDASLDWLRDKANDYFHEGDFYNNITYLRISMNILDILFEWCPMPEQRATIFFEKGMVQKALGQRVADNRDLEQATESFGFARDECDPNVHPYHWAMIHLNRGSALQALGHRKASLKILKDAESDYLEAEKYCRGERAKSEWAMIQNGLGAVYFSMGTLQAGLAYIIESVNRYNKAVDHFESQPDRSTIAMIKNNLGLAHLALAKVGHPPTESHLSLAESAFNSSILEYVGINNSIETSKGRNNLAEVLLIRGSISNRVEVLMWAERLAKQSLSELDPKLVTFEWAAANANIGNILVALSEHETGCGCLKESLDFFEQALKVRTEARNPFQWATTLGGEALAKLRLAERTDDTPLASEALKQLRTAENRLRARAHFPEASSLAHFIPDAEALVARLGGEA